MIDSSRQYFAEGILQYFALKNGEGDDLGSQEILTTLYLNSARAGRLD